MGIRERDQGISGKGKTFLSFFRRKSGRDFKGLDRKCRRKKTKLGKDAIRFPVNMGKHRHTLMAFYLLHHVLEGKSHRDRKERGLSGNNVAFLTDNPLLSPYLCVKRKSEKMFLYEVVESQKVVKSRKIGEEMYLFSGLHLYTGNDPEPEPLPKGERHRNVVAGIVIGYRDAIKALL
jgi:hypothetical protein